MYRHLALIAAMLVFGGFAGCVPMEDSTPEPTANEMTWDNANWDEAEWQ